ncbi:MAG: oxidoreductase [Leptospiraceae bacterium]|nr:hypothetical protein [Leptospiraceae bacterium]MCP5496407.1 oxidoreductase [Leptospiraceae bacterium]
MNKYKVLETRQLTPDCFVLKTERNGLAFQAGQCVNIGIGTGVNREYSLYSGEKDDYLEFLIRVIPNGSVSPYLQKLNPGDFVEIHGSYGLFTLRHPEDKSLKYIFIGTGTGIAPFHTYIRTYPDLDYKVIHGIRFANETYDKNHYAEKRYLSCVSRESGGDFQGRVTDYIKSIDVQEGTRIYLCGNRFMISDIFDILIEKGHSGDHIITEAFF